MVYRFDADIDSRPASTPIRRGNQARVTGRSTPQRPDEDDEWSQPAGNA